MLLNLYVSQIPYKTSESEIYAYFSNFGEIKNLSIAKGKGNWNKLNAKIDLQSSNSYSHITNKSHYLGGSRVIVDRFLTGEDLQVKNKSIGNRRVSLFGIKGPATSKDVLHFLRCFGEIESHHFIKYKDKKNKKYGFVTFATEESARKCVLCEAIEVNGVEIKIKPYKFKKEEDSEEMRQVPIQTSFYHPGQANLNQRSFNALPSEKTDPSPQEVKRKVFKKKIEPKGVEKIRQQLGNSVVHKIREIPEFNTQKRISNTMKEILEISTWIDEYHQYGNIMLNKPINTQRYSRELNYGYRNLEY